MGVKTTRAGSWRTATALLVALGASAASGIPATAATKPTPASVSSVQVKSGNASGILTIRGASAGKVEGVTADISGVATPVALTPVNQARRVTMLVVDTSGSMGTAGMETVRQATAGFLKDVPADVLVGLVSFAGTAGVDVTPTKDRARIQKAVNALRSRGETSLYDGVAQAVSALGNEGERSIVLLSDGGDTWSKKATQATATAALRARGIRAEIIAFKTDDSNTSVLKGFAAAGGGTVAQAGDDAAVRAAFKAAAKALESQVKFSITVPADLRSKQVLRLAGTFGGAPFEVRTPVDLGAAPVVLPSATTATSTIAPDDQAVPAPKVATAKGGFAPQLLAALAATFLGLLVLTLALLSNSLRSSRKSRVDGVEQYIPGARVVANRAASASPGAISASFVQFGDKVMDGRESTGKTMALIERADLPLRAGEWWVLRIVSVAVVAALGLALLPGGAIGRSVGFILGGLVGFGVPSLVLKFLAKRRTKKFEAQLPDLFLLAASSLSTGFSLPQALDAVAKDAPMPAGKEFSRSLAETRIGVDIADALETMALRMDSTNLRWTSMAIRIQREVGGNLAATLRTTSKTLREREELRRHVRALSAEGRLSSAILIGLPIMLFLYMLKVNYEYISLLWTEQLGWVMSIGALISIGIGIAWMRKVVEVEV